MGGEWEVASYPGPMPDPWSDSTTRTAACAAETHALSQDLNATRAHLGLRIEVREGCLRGATHQWSNSPSTAQREGAIREATWTLRLERAKTLQRWVGLQRWVLPRRLRLTSN